jgi:hypothetical protein
MTTNFGLDIRLIVVLAISNLVTTGCGSAQHPYSKDKRTVMDVSNTSDEVPRFVVKDLTKICIGLDVRTDAIRVIEAGGEDMSDASLDRILYSVAGLFEQSLLKQHLSVTTKNADLPSRVIALRDPFPLSQCGSGGDAIIVRNDVTLSDDGKGYSIRVSIRQQGRSYIKNLTRPFPRPYKGNVYIPTDVQTSPDGAKIYEVFRDVYVLNASVVNLIAGA